MHEGFRLAILHKAQGGLWVMNSKSLIQLGFLSILSFGCGSTTQAVNDSRINPQDQNIPLTPSSPSQNSDSPQIQFHSLASVRALKSEAGEEMQATNFAFYKDMAVVSYNRAGEKVRGAIEVFSLANPKKPEIIGSLHYKDAEFSDVKVRDGLAYVVGSDGVNGAIIKLISLEDPKAPTEKASASLEGFYATSVSVQGDSVFVTSGDNRGLIELNADTLERKSEWKLPSATFVYASENSVMVAGGEPYSFYQVVKDELHEVVRLSEQPAEAPSRFAVSDEYLVANPTAEGLLVFKYNQKEAAAKLVGRVDVKGTGNGIDLYKHLVFISQGEAGVQVFDVENAESPKNMGRLEYSHLGSANQVKYGSVSSAKENWNCLLIANGAGGFEILKFEVK